MKGKNDGLRTEILADDSVAGLGGFADFQLASDPDWLDIFAGSDTSLPGSDGTDLQMDALSTEADFLGSYDSSEALHEGEEQRFSVTFESTEETEKGVMPREILEFEDGALRWSALCIYQALRVLVRQIDTPSKCHDVANWIFGRPPGGSEPQVTFEDCCYAHNARPDVLRMRIMFELWRLEKRAASPFNLAAYDLPDFIADTVFLELGFHAHAMAKALWTFPGATVSQLRNLVSDTELSSLTGLEHHYLASPSETRNSAGEVSWYLTGVNPILKTQDQIRPTLNRQRRIDLSWSSHFPE